ncbi:MAG: hypothetical protein IT323_07680 [Anaerolineae bacterium]|nr:hypothetical protein [Anaerolineae bacterium]
MHKHFTWAALVAVILLVSACGGGGSATTAPTPPAPETTAAPTDVPAPATPELSESVTSKNGVTVSYPSGWPAPIADVGVFLFNSTNAQTGAFSLFRMGDGQLAFQINAQANASNRTPEDLFKFSFEGLATSLGMTLPAPERLKVDDVDALKATTTGDAMGIYYALLPTGDEMYPFATFVAFANPNELEANIPLFEAMLATVKVDTP